MNDPDADPASLVRDHLLRCLEGEASGDTEFLARHPDCASMLARERALLDEVDGLLERERHGTLRQEIPAHFDGLRLTDELGRGGMGVVFRAHDEGLGHDVAVKLSEPMHGLDDHARARHRREVESLARLRHPGIVTVHRAGTLRGRGYLVMELVEGRDLAGDASAEGCLDDPGATRVALERCRDVALALHHAHEAGVTHRDVKPSNIVIDGDGTPVLIDFGLARDERSETLTRTGDFVGTLDYTAPEQALGREVDRRVDVFGLGATLHRLLFGRAPVTARTLLELTRRFDDEDELLARPDRRRLPRDLAAVLARALAIRPEDRYASARDLANELDALLRGEPVRARPLSTAARLSRSVRRRPARFVAGAACLVLVAVAAFALRQRVIENRLEAEARFENDLDEGIMFWAIDDPLRSQEAMDRAVRARPGDADADLFSRLARIPRHGTAGWAEGARLVAREIDALPEDRREDPHLSFLRDGIELALANGDTGALSVFAERELDAFDDASVAAAACVARALGLGQLATERLAILARSPTAPYRVLFVNALIQPGRGSISGLDSAVRARQHKRTPSTRYLAARFTFFEAKDRELRLWCIEEMRACRERFPESMGLMNDLAVMLAEAKPSGWVDEAAELYRRSMPAGFVMTPNNLSNLLWDMKVERDHDPAALDEVYELYLAMLDGPYARRSGYWWRMADICRRRGRLAALEEHLDVGESMGVEDIGCQISVERFRLAIGDPRAAWSPDAVELFRSAVEQARTPWDFDELSDLALLPQAPRGIQGLLLSAVHAFEGGGGSPGRTTLRWLLREAGDPSGG